MIKKLLIFVFIATFVASCSPEPIEKYCGGIVIAKYVNRKVFVLKYKGKIIDVLLYEYDYNRYKEGDTIKCSEEDEKLYQEKPEVSDDEEDDIWNR